MAAFEAIADTHPRIHFCAADVPKLRERARTTHSQYFQRLLGAAEVYSRMDLPMPLGTGDDHRSFGEMLSLLAMAFVISQDEKHLAQCRRFLEPMIATESWQDGIGLVTGHQMGGVAMAYDWLYDVLSESERERIRGRIRAVAAQTYRMSFEQRVRWHDMFLQNWCHVPTSTLSYAAAAVSGEVDEAAEWIRHADTVFTRVAEALSPDGNCEEGQAYMTYGWEWILRYFDVARGVFGIDHWDCEGLRNAPYVMIYSILPRIEPGNYFMTFGDGRRRIWNGPAHQLFRSADEYRDARVQAFARHLINSGIGMTDGEAWLNLLWDNPEVEERDWRDLPTARFFPWLPTVFTRSSWDEDALALGFKCTSNQSEHVKKAFPGRDLGTGHAHPDAASFQVYAFGRWLAIDPGYTVWKTTEEHNTITVNGIGQLGGDNIWFEGRNTLTAEPCGITSFESSSEFDYIRADASGIYKRAAKLTRFVRHLIYLRPHDVVIVDELEAAEDATFEWYIHAEDEIVAEGNQFLFSKGDARARVLWLAPEDFHAEIFRQKIAFVAPEPLQEMTALKIRPRRDCRKALFASLISFYRGDAPETQGTLASAREGMVRLALERGGRERSLTLDLAGAVTLD